MPDRPGRAPTVPALPYACVMILDRHRPAELVTAACRVAGASLRDISRHDSSGVLAYQAAGTEAFVSVCYPVGALDAAGLVTALHPGVDDSSRPDGHALVVFSAGGVDGAHQEWPRHAGLARELGAWLSGSGIRWVWRLGSPVAPPNPGHPPGRLRAMLLRTPVAAERRSRYQTLPIETVSRMRSGDFGVLMSKIQPRGYITPGSFTNEGYRVSELADSIRRNGVGRPLRVYMGRKRPVVADGQHRYVAAEIAGAAHLPIEITHPEDIRDVTKWARIPEVSEVKGMSGGEELTFADMAREVRGEAWAALGYYCGGVIGGLDREQVASTAGSGPRPGAEMAAELEP